MNKIKILLKDDTLTIYGKITFDNIVKTLNECIEKTTHNEQIYMDLKNLYNCDSTVLLFIINCIKHEIKTNKKITFLNVSNLILDLSKVYNLTNIIKKKIKKD